MSFYQFLHTAVNLRQVFKITVLLMTPALYHHTKLDYYTIEKSILVHTCSIHAIKPKTIIIIQLNTVVPLIQRSALILLLCAKTLVEYCLQTIPVSPISILYFIFTCLLLFLLLHLQYCCLLSHKKCLSVQIKIQSAEGLHLSAIHCVYMYVYT